MTRKELYQKYRKRFPQIPAEAILVMLRASPNRLEESIAEGGLTVFVRDPILIEKMKTVMKETDNGS